MLGQNRRYPNRRQEARIAKPGSLPRAPAFFQQCGEFRLEAREHVVAALALAFDHASRHESGADAG